jgi:hypothetical protein
VNKKPAFAADEFAEFLVAQCPLCDQRVQGVASTKHSKAAAAALSHLQCSERACPCRVLRLKFECSQKVLSRKRLFSGQFKCTTLSAPPVKKAAKQNDTARRAAIVRSAVATGGDVSGLKNSLSGGNLSLIEASIWRISVKRP